MPVGVQVVIVSRWGHAVRSRGMNMRVCAAGLWVCVASRYVRWKIVVSV